MKTAAAVFSWLGGIVTVIYTWVMVAIYAASLSMPALYVIPIVQTIIVLVVLIWRQVSVENGNKVGCGVCTLLFASLIGGILTLCIPDSQLYGYSSSSSYKSTNSSSNSKSLSSLDRTILIRDYENKLRDGEITKAEYDEKIALLNGRTPTKKSSEEEKIDLISKYKKLYDEGAITQEEYEEKKKELLK